MAVELVVEADGTDDAALQMRDCKACQSMLYIAKEGKSMTWQRTAGSVVLTILAAASITPNAAAMSVN